jgi:hypothetical protein
MIPLKNNALLIQNQAEMRNNSAKNAEQCQIALILFRILFRNEGVYAENCQIKEEK